jgi:hypothetical protein
MGPPYAAIYFNGVSMRCELDGFEFRRESKLTLMDGQEKFETTV